MKRIYFLVLLTILFGGCNAQEDGKEYTVIVTDAMILEEKQNCPSKNEVEQLENEIKDLDTLSIEKIKSNLKSRYDYFRKNKKEIIKAYQEDNQSIEDRFKSLTKIYSKEEERLSEKEDLYSNLINTNHLQYRDSLQKNKYFNQFFKDSTSSFKMAVRNGGATIYDFSLGQTFYPYYGTNEHTHVENKVVNIYYHDSKEEGVPISFESYIFPLNPVKIPQRKHIDSLEVLFKLKYLTSIDTIRFTKDDIGKEKMGVTLLKMEDNYVEYKVPYDYYGMYKGQILEEEFFNKEDKLIDNEFALSNSTLENPEERYDENFKYNKLVYFSTKNIDNRKDLYKVLTYFSLKFTNEYLQSKTINRQALKGNVASLKLYLENTRDSISYSVMFHNNSSVQNMYVHTLNNKTEFIDKNGRALKTIPAEIKFLYNGSTETYSKTYFTTTDEDRTEHFYFLDQENVTYQELPYEELRFLCPSLLIARHKDDNNWYLISTTENRKLLDEKITNFHLFRYLEKAIFLYIDNTSYYIFDQNKELITPDTDTPITKIYLKKEYDY